MATVETTLPDLTEAPRFFWLEITNKCQLECTMCYADSSPAGTHGTMSTRDWKLVIDQAAAMGTIMVKFIGGEPALHPGLPDLIGHALSAGLPVEVLTNLVHVTDELWRVFEQPGVSLSTSYFSDDPDQHNAITRRSHSYDRTRANITEAIRRGIPIRAGVIDLGDGQRVDQAHTELAGLAVSEIGYDRIRQVGRGERDQQADATQLCGRCGDGVAAIGPDGEVRACVFARWTQPLGNVCDQPLTVLTAELPTARHALIAAGMPDPVRPCDPESTGTNCYPHNKAVMSGRVRPCDPESTGTNCYPHNRQAR